MKTKLGTTRHRTAETAPTGFCTTGSPPALALLLAAAFLLNGAGLIAQTPAALSSTPASTPAVAATATPDPKLQEAHKDPILAAMLDELDRSRSLLQLQGFQKPFFIEYRLEDLTNYEASAAFGSLTSEGGGHHRAVRVKVLVGDYKTDSSGPGNMGNGSLQIAAIEDDPAALRYALWTATDTAYKEALRSLAQKQSELKSVQTPPQADDFSHEQPAVVLEPLCHLDLDRSAWKQSIAEASGLYRAPAKAAATTSDGPAAVEFSSATIDAQALNRYVVNTEGTVLRTAQPLYHANLKVSGQAADGMRIDRSYSSVGTQASQLASAAEFRKKSLETVDQLRDIEQAPLVESEYHGPILLESHAAANEFEEIFAAAVAAPRPQLGTEARTTGAFASSYKTRVLPDTFTVTDDPTLKTFGDKPVLGAYEVDDEGVAARPVAVVQQGRLVNYVIGRQPVRDFPASNGHGRAPLGNGAEPHYAVLHVEASDGLPPDQLQAKLLAMAKDNSLPAAYVAASNGRIYRIAAADGKRELVRGADLADLDQRALRSSIVAAGNDSYVLNLVEGIPSTVIAPSLLFEDGTVKRADKQNDKLPYYPPPD